MSDRIGPLTVVIPCAGTGSRLGEHTGYINKGMITLGERPIISYILEKFRKEDEIIVLLGYKGDYMRQTIEALYPEWNISFVDVDNYEGKGSGLGYSLSRAREFLQRPFIFWANDTLVEGTDPVREFSRCNTNWILYSALDSAGHGEKEGDPVPSDYRYASISEDGSLVEIMEKGHPWDELAGGHFPYVGVCCIRDYREFWEALDNDPDKFISEGEVAGINNICSSPGTSRFSCFYAHGWVDLGNRKILEEYIEKERRLMLANVLEKPEETIWFHGGFVTKFHISNRFIRDRVDRAPTVLHEEHLSRGLRLPEIVGHSENTYTYRYAKGEVLSRIVDTRMMKDLLERFFLDRYTEGYIVDLPNEEKLSICREFYLNRTISRVGRYLDGREETWERINGLYCVPVLFLLNEKLNWYQISEDSLFTAHYHGDFHLENILYDRKSDIFTLLDWRQNFGSSVYGDIYYDLAKMWHSLIVSHSKVREGRYLVERNDEGDITLDIDRTFMLTECEKVLENFIEENYDRDHAELMTSLIFLNISACHVEPYSTFLFYMGKYLLNRYAVKKRLL